MLSLIGRSITKVNKAKYDQGRVCRVVLTIRIPANMNLAPSRHISITAAEQEADMCFMSSI